MVLCREQCQRTFVSLTIGSGDADLCISNKTTETNSPQTHLNLKECTLCHSRNSGGRKEFCAIPEDPVGQKFYVSVHAYTSFTNVNLTITGRNLFHVESLGTVSPPTTTTTTT